MNIILFGAPGSGKGTQVVLLEKYFHSPRISLGDILRQEVKKDNPLGQEVKSYMEKGLLAPDELVSRVIEANLGQDGFILEGYPRNLSQAKHLKGILEKKKQKVDFFIYLDVDEETIVSRLTQRLVCKNCNANYNLKNMPPKQKGICDSCGAKLAQRQDDNLSVIKKRWEIFLKESQKVLDFYRKEGNMVRVDGRGSQDDIFERIKNKLPCPRV